MLLCTILSFQYNIFHAVPYAWSALPELIHKATTFSLKPLLKTHLPCDPNEAVLSVTMARQRGS